MRRVTKSKRHVFHHDQINDGYTKIIFKTTQDKERIRFLRSFFFEYQRLRETISLHLTPPLSIKELTNISPGLTLIELVTYFLHAKYPPEISSIITRRDEIVYLVPSQFDIHWFYALESQMSYRLKTQKRTVIKCIYANGYKRPSRKPFYHKASRNAPQTCM